MSSSSIGARALFSPTDNVAKFVLLQCITWQWIQLVIGIEIVFKMCILPIQYLHHEYRRRDRWAWVLPDTDIWVRVECRWKRRLAVEVERPGKKRGTRPDHQTFLQLGGWDLHRVFTCWLCESHESWFNRKERWWAGQSQGQPTKFASCILRKILSPPYSEYARRVCLCARIKLKRKTWLFHFPLAVPFAFAWLSLDCVTGRFLSISLKNDCNYPTRIIARNANSDSR